MDHQPVSKPFYKSLYFQVITAIVIGVLLGHFYPRDRRGDEAAGRRLHQADQDDHRADHLLHGGGRHRRHGGHEEGRQDRRPGAAVLRGRQHHRAGRRAGDHQHRAARRRHERRREPRSTPRRSPPTPSPGKMQGTIDFLLQRDPEHGGRRLRQGRDPAGAAVRGDVRLRAAQVRRARHAGVRLHREVLARAVRRSSATS